MSGNQRQNRWKGRAMFDRARSLFRRAPALEQELYQQGSAKSSKAQIYSDRLGQTKVQGAGPGGSQVAQELSNVDSYLLNWNWDNIGKDHTKPVPTNKPLNDTHMRYIKNLGIKFIRYLGMESYGTAWRVEVKNYGTHFRDVLTCKVFTLNTWYGVRGRLPLSIPVKLMLHETVILGQLSHPNIIQLINGVQIPDKRTGFLFSAVCLLMEQTDGTLYQLIQRPVAHLLLEWECKEWFEQIAEAVRYLHYNNVVHLSIRPEVIRYVLKGSKVFKLCDFYNAIDFGERESIITGQYVGSPYLAPEVRGEGYVNPGGYDIKLGDVWSLCIALIVALTGVDKDPLILLNDLRAREWRNIRYVPYPPSSELAELMILMTEIDPEDRLSIDEVCAHRWLNS